jgi:hypothetical protein
MSLDYELKRFHSWLNQHASPGFMKYAEDTYYSEYDGVTIEEELFSYASEMKDAVKLNDEVYFDEAKKRYLEIFQDANKKICIKLYDKILDDLAMDESLLPEEAAQIALERAWSYPHVRYWLPISALLKDGEGKEVYLVSRKAFAPKGKNYITISELSEIKDTGLDPWAYVQGRAA